jgi:hypothetical protein
VLASASDPEVVIAEYELHGKLTGTAEPFALCFLMVMTIRGKLPELLAALTAGA